MNNYKRFVADLASERSDMTFLNSDKDHAIEVLTQIFKHSNSDVRIFAGSLCSDVGNSLDYIESLSDFIERGGKVHILLNKYDSESAKSSSLFKRLAYYISENKSIIVKQTSSKPYFSNDPEKKEIHFTLGDDKAYRIETDISKRMAECNFNNPMVAKIYIDFFEKLFNQDNAILIDIPSLFKLA